MKVLIIRHAEPDYENNCLTDKGKREAELLSLKLNNENIKDIYVSPLNRAILTAQPTAKSLNKEPTVLDWLTEFTEKLNFSYDTDFYKDMKSPWNMPPKLWCKDELIFDNNNWNKSKIVSDTKISEIYNSISAEFDKLLLKYGYLRNDNYYEITDNTFDNITIALFCHFGVGTAIISHILNMPLIPIWNSVFLPPSSVTTLYMEKHIKTENIAHGIFAGIGDTSHLYKYDENISCSGLHTNKLI